MAYGIVIKQGHEGVRVEIGCPHQHGMLYAVRSKASWVCSADLLHAHALAGFLRELVRLENPAVDALMQKWGLYYRELPLEDQAPAPTASAPQTTSP
ncbi:MAG: hypothetical protein NZ951_05505 [Dehalococcoidia bacterium]|nr:hypothetical protein [Dehalococcoidia bacterium]MDW8120228.1 hypothetical protein [Chloroflexota bacterium]